MKTTSLWTGLLLMAAVLVVAFGARSVSAPGSAPAPAPGSPQPSAAGEPAYLNCTVRAVELKVRAVDVITGVGYALRQYRMSVAPACEIMVAGTATDLASLKPGTIVRVRYKPVPAAPKVPAHLVATAIETVHLSETGGDR